MSDPEHIYSFPLESENQHIKRAKSSETIKVSETEDEDLPRLESLPEENSQENYFQFSNHSIIRFKMQFNFIMNFDSFYLRVNWMKPFVKTQTPGYRRSISTNSSASSTAHLLGSTQTREVRATWSVILSQLQKVGVQCIVDLFELHPFVKEHFKEVLVKHSKVDNFKFSI